MKKIIHNLRQQPEEIRRHVLHLITFVFIVIMVTLWVFSLGGKLSSPDTKEKIKQDLQPFNSLRANLIDGYQGVSDSSNQ